MIRRRLHARTAHRLPHRATAGNFPLWLAPDQVRVITLNDDEALINYAQPIVAELRANMVRVDSDFSATPFKAKIANAGVASSLWLERSAHSADTTRCSSSANAWLRRGSVGGHDMEAGAVSVRLHHGGPQGAKPKVEVIADILASIKERRD
ncbi:MAG: hypothetical protein PHY43_00565 [Verrucomicrobiales bacterium]|nr:hypothetical protein [Verrucomicrobiales bacterium]